MEIQNIRQIVREASGIAAGGEIYSPDPDATGAVPPTDQQYEADQAGQPTAGQQGVTRSSAQGYPSAYPSQGEYTTATYTNEDFYPGDADPAQFGFREGLQVVARPGRLPMAAITKAAASIQQKRRSVDKSKKDLYDLLDKRVAIQDPNRLKSYYDYQKKTVDNEILNIAEPELQYEISREREKVQKREDRFRNRAEGRGFLGVIADEEQKAKYQAKADSLKTKAADIQKTEAEKLAAAKASFFSDPRKVDKIYAEIAKDPRKRGRMIELMREFEAYGAVMDKNYNEAKAYIQDYNTPNKEFVRDEYLYKRATDIVSPGKDGLAMKGGRIEGGVSFEDLLDSSTKFNRAVTLNDYFNRQIMPAAKDVGYQLDSTDPVDKGRYWLITDEKKWPAFIEAQSAILAKNAPEALEDYAESQGLKGQSMKDIAKHYLERMLPAKVEKKATAKPVGGGRAGGDNKTEYAIGAVADTETIIPNAAEAYGGTPQPGATMGILAVPLSMTTGGKAVTPEPLNFQKGNQNVTMIPLRVEMNKANNQAYVVGLDANDETVNSIIEKEGGINSFKMEASGLTITTTGSDGKVTTRKITSRPIVYVPINGPTRDANYNLAQLSDNWAGVEALLRKNMAAPTPSTGLPVR
jgi:hypothetical protein